MFTASLKNAICSKMCLFKKIYTSKENVETKNLESSLINIYLS